MTTADPLSQRLQLVLGFTPDDLSNNRAGYLGKTQAAQLGQSARPYWRLMTIAGGFALVLLAVLVAFSGGSREAPILYLLVLLVPGGLCAIYAVRVAGIYASVGDGRVTVVEGLATTYAKTTINGGAAFYVRIGNEEFFVSRSQQSAFEPGHTYRVYYTPKGRLIVSGELVTPSQAFTSDDLAPELAAALRFQRDDLNANRAGRLSPAQVAQLRRSRNHQIGLGVICGLASCGTLLFFPQFSGSASQLLCFGLVLLLPVGLCGASVWATVQRTRDMQFAEVVALQGKVERSAEHVGSVRSRPVFALRIADVKLHVSLDVYGAFVDGRRYTVYVAPRSRVLLSAELG